MRNITRKGRLPNFLFEVGAKILKYLWVGASRRTPCILTSILRNWREREREKRKTIL